VTWTLYHKRETPTRQLPIDSVGLALLVIWVGAMQITLDIGKEHDWFHSDAVVALAIVAVGLALFLVWERTDPHPVVDLALFKRRNFWAGALATSVGYGLFFGNVVLLPLWLQQYMGYTATQAGLVMAPVGVMALVLSPWVGKNISKFDPRHFATFAFLVFALVLWMRSNFNTQADLATIMVPTIVQGWRWPSSSSPGHDHAVGHLAGPIPRPPCRTSPASPRAFGTSISTTVWENRASLHHAQLVESIQQGNATAMAALQGLGGAGLTPEQALAQVNRLVDQQAFMLAANDVFLASAIIFLFLIPWSGCRTRCRPPAPAPTRPPAH
jgi:DHA2 family multidrug resistance protein